MNAMEESHLTIETMINGKRVGMQEIHDPFLHNRTTMELSMIDRIKLLFTGRILFEVKVRGDNEAHSQWFRTDPLPRVYHEKKATVSNATDGEQSAPTDRA